MNQRRRNQNQPRHRKHARSDDRSGKTEYIPSPYNFVPLSSRVFFPEDAPKSSPSIDKPFTYKISGALTIKVTTKTTIYIRNGGTHPTNYNKKLKDPDAQS